MKAIVLSAPGKNPNYEEFDISRKPSDESIKIIASALNHRDLWIIKGQYAGIKYPIILGSDGVGIYKGKRVIINPGQYWGNNEIVQDKNFKILGLPDHGTFADYTYTNKKFIYDAPEHMSNEECAALPLAGLTAYRALISRGNSKRNEKLLIVGIGGGVALFLLQFAKAIGMEVSVTSSSEEKIEKAKELGAKDGFIYTEENWTKKTDGFDIIIDSAAGDGFKDYLKIINPGGRIVIYGGTQGKINNIVPQIIFWKQVSILGSTMGSDKDFKEMLDLVNAFKIKPIIDSVFSITNHSDAFDKMDKGEQFGKIVLRNE